MIRIKVFPLRKIINKIQIIFLFTIFLITMFILISIIYKQKDEKVKEILSVALIKNETKIDKSEFINNILKNKVRILIDCDASNYKQIIFDKTYKLTELYTTLIEDVNKCI